ncbi:MAG: cation-translocating P-type ATPase, partial [Finegoldia magna]
MDWYKESNESVIKSLDTDQNNGLSDSKVTSLLEKYGKNVLKEKKKKSMAAKLKDQFLDPMIIILLLASILSMAIGEVTDSIIIIAIVIVNAVLSIYQEGKAEQAIEALQKMASPKAKVIRNGKIMEVDSQNLVPGDIVELETGDIIPADLKLLESTNLKIDESSLTGESVAVEKNAKDEITTDAGIGDRTNMAYSSSIVSYGRAKGVVVETAQNTEIGKIATSLSQVEDEETPLQRKLAQLSKQLGIVTVVVCAIVFAVGYFLYDFDALNMLMTAVSLAVAAIPEGLPAIVTIVLSLGMGRMAEKNAIVKKLLAVETLGTTTVICSDKTGTLTQNEMTVKKIYVDGTDVDVTGTGYKPEGDYL